MNMAGKNYLKEDVKSFFVVVGALFGFATIFVDFYAFQMFTV